MPILKDAKNEVDRVTLPESGTLTVGAELPDGLDLEMLQRELAWFWGDRLSIEYPPEPEPEAEPAEEKPVKRSTRRKARS